MARFSKTIFQFYSSQADTSKHFSLLFLSYIKGKSTLFNYNPLTHAPNHDPTSYPKLSTPGLYLSTVGCLFNIYVFISGWARSLRLSADCL